MYPGKIEDFVATSHIQFDFVYLDFTGPLFSASSKPFRSLHGILEKHGLSPLSVLIVNTAEPEPTEDSVNLLSRYFQHQLWVEGSVYGEKGEDGERVDHYIDGPDSYCYERQQLRALVRQKSADRKVVGVRPLPVGCSPFIINCLHPFLPFRPCGGRIEGRMIVGICTLANLSTRVQCSSGSWILFTENGIAD
jgi:hypothetical protein